MNGDYGYFRVVVYRRDFRVCDSGMRSACLLGGPFIYRDDN
jgi:hypothetical protein